MAIEIGRYNILEVRQKADPGLYLGKGAETVLLPWRYVPDGTEIGERMRVFVYTDSEDRPVATTVRPKAVVGEVALLEVVAVGRHGAFLDWGLPKDLFAPFDEMHRDVVVGRRYVFALSLDHEGRVKASGQIHRHLDYDVSDMEVGDEVDLLVYGHNDVGMLVVVDGRHAGIVYHDEAFRSLAIGAETKGYVHQIRPDSKLDVRLQRPGAEGAEDARHVVIAAVRAAGGFLPLHDKSSPDEIRAQLALSKKAYKRAIGQLYKARRIALRPDGIELLGSEPLDEP